MSSNQVKHKDGFFFNEKECSIYAARFALGAASATIIGTIIVALVLKNSGYNNINSTTLVTLIAATIGYYSAIFWIGSNHKGIILHNVPFTFTIVK